jgi:hypothetical protein
MTPKIRTAVPRRRYQFGEFNAVLLGEVDSDDERAYAHVLALIPEGAGEPTLYVTAEPNNEEGGTGSHRLRVYTADDGRDLGAADDWADVEPFTEAAFEVASRVLKLSDETPHPLA